MDTRIRIQNLLNDEQPTSPQKSGGNKRLSPSFETTSPQSVSSETEQHENKKVNRAKKEQLRRSRMNQFFDELKAILPKERDRLEASRITKEDVLEKSVEYIDQLRTEIRMIKRRRGLVDPAHVIGISQQEIDAGFNVLYPIEYNKFSSIYTNELRELAEKSTRDEHKLAVNFMHSMLGAAYQFDPIRVSEVVYSTLKFYRKIKKNPNDSSESYLTYFRTDLKVVCLANLSVAMAHLGKFDESDKIMTKATNYVKKIGHMPSQNMLHLFTRQLYCIRGDPLPSKIGHDIYQSLKDDPIWNYHGPLYYYTALLENGQRDLKLINEMSDYIEKISSLYGSMSQSTMSGLYVYIMYKINPLLSLDFLNKEIAKYRKFRVSSTFSVAEFLRLKACVLMESKENEKEVESLLVEARMKAKEENWVNTELKVLLDLERFYEKMEKERGEVVRDLKRIVNIVEMCSKENPPSSVLVAREIVNKYKV